MKQQFDTLVWIGAGSAESPADLISLAKRSILVEARELACNALKEHFAGNSQVQVVQQCISSTGGKLNWYQYNLAEFSATAEASGLKALFPGLKLQQCSELDSMALIPFLTDLALREGKKALLLDCPAQNASFLGEVLVQNKIQFDSLYISASEHALYQGMRTQQELIAELQQHGYQLDTIDSTDPDFPILHFSLNPLWQHLQVEKTHNQTLRKQLESLQAEAQQQVELIKQLEQTKQQLEQVKKHAATRLDKIAELEKNNRQLHETNTQLCKRQQALEQEMLKAEAQIDIIKELLLK